MEPSDFYGVARAGYNCLRRELGWLGGGPESDPHPEEERLTRAIGSGLLHLDDPERLHCLVAALSAPEPPVAEALGKRELRSWRMLLVQLFGSGPRWRPLAEAWALLWQAGALRQELIQLLALLAERCERRLQPLPWALPVPLRVHGRYSRAEVMAAFSVLDANDAPRNHREGVLWHQPSQCDLLFVTLNKSEALFSPSTRYRDLALGPSLFHWESQSVTTASSATGQRYIQHASRGSRVLLFVREHRREGGRAGGVTEPFRCLGFAHYASHEGERPMAIRWRLEMPIPAAWLPGCCRAKRGVGGVRANPISRLVHAYGLAESSRIIRARLTLLADSTNSASSSAEVSKPG